MVKWAQVHTYPLCPASGGKAARHTPTLPAEGARGRWTLEGRSCACDTAVPWHRFKQDNGSAQGVTKFP